MISKHATAPVFSRKASAKNALSIIIKICVSAAVIFLLLSRIKLSPIIAALQAYRVSSLYAPLILYLLFGFWASIKWKLLLPDIQFRPLVRISFARYFYALIALGIVTGDLARAYLLGKQDKERAAAITASVIVDRATGFIGLTVTGIVGSMASSRHIPAAVPICCSAAFVICLAVLFSLRSALCYGFISKLTESSVRPLPPLKPVVRALSRCIDALHLYVKQSKLMVMSIAAGVVSQVILIAAIALVGSGLGLKVAFWDWCWIFCVVSMTVLIPVTVSGLGVREGSFVALLSLLGIGADKAMALSLLVFFLDAVLGLIGLACHHGKKAHLPAHFRAEIHQ